MEVDTLELHPLPGVTIKQFTARDVVSRGDVLDAHTPRHRHPRRGVIAADRLREPTLRLDAPYQKQMDELVDLARALGRELPRAARH